MARPTKTQTRLQQLTSLLLFLAVIGLAGYLSTEFKIEADWTAGNRNTITEASRKQLDAMPGAIRFTAFIAPSAEIRKAIESQVARYQRFKDDIELEFIDPSAHPERVREMGIGAAGEVVIEYQGRTEKLRTLSEPAITTALQRLAYSGEQWVVFLTGHGERRIDGDAPTALSAFAKALREKGLKVRELNLVQNPQIPANTSVLVIAAPQKALLEGEQKLIADYVKHGGNLLWLTDPDLDTGIAPLAEALGIAWQRGYAIFPDYQLLGTGHPAFFLAFEYPDTAVTRELADITVFPLVQSVTWKADAGWVVKPFLQTGERVWLETGKIEGDLSFSAEDGDVPGPLDIGLLLTRSVKPEAKAKDKDKPKADADDADGADDGEDQAQTPADAERTQRVAVVGDVDFLSNGYLHQLANQQLALNLVQWLASRDAQLDIDIPEAPDSSLYLPPWAVILIGLGFVGIVPLALLGFGVGRWYLRRRA